MIATKDRKAVEKKITDMEGHTKIDLTLFVPHNTEFDVMQKIYKTMLEVCTEHGITILTSNQVRQENGKERKKGKD